MSLINEMLRNLEQRQTGDVPDAASEATVVPAARKSSRYLLLLVGVLLVVGLVWFWSFMTPQNVVGEGGRASVANQLAAEHAVVKIMPESGKEEVPHVAGDPPAVSEEAPAVADSESVALVGLAVTETADGAVLTLNFNHPPTYRLVQKKSDSRLEMTFDRVDVGAGFEIPALPENFRQISLVPQRQALQLLVDLNNDSHLKSYQLLNGPEAGCRLQIEIVTVAAAAQSVQEPVPTKAEPVAAVEEEVEVVEAPETSEAAGPKPTVSKNKNTLAPDQKAYLAGLKQLQGGHWVAAEAGFRQALTLNSELLDARLKLVELYQQQAKFAQAEELLREGISLFPGNFVMRKILARQLLKDHRLDEAVELLEKQPQPRMAQDLEYHALLAALLQEAGRYDDSRLLYSRLVQVRPQAALWWMGLAISLDQGNHSAAARDAYQQALVLPGLRPDLQDYIHNRLQVL